MDLSRRSFSIGLGVALVGYGLAARAADKWDLACAYPQDNFQTQNIEWFAKQVAALSKDQLRLDVHANATLFKAPEIKRAVQGDQVQIGEVLLVNYSNENPLFELDGIPFLATGYASAMKLYEAQKPALEKLLESQGMMLLYAVPWPPQGIFTNRVLNTVTDMKGLKWRAYSPSTAKIAELVGAQPVTVQAAELSQAMATGVIDSYISSPATGYDSKTYEYIKRFYNVQAWLPKNAVIVNRSAFDRLPKGSQQALLKAAAEAQTHGWKLSEEKTGWYIDQLKKHGVQIDQPPAALEVGLKKVGDTMLQDWLKKSGVQGQDIVAAYRKLGG